MTEHPTVSDPASPRNTQRISMIRPEFREDFGEPPRRAGMFRLRAPSHPKDLRNLKFAMASAVVTLVIFGVLEGKQFRDAKREKHAHVHAAEPNR